MSELARGVLFWLPYFLLGELLAVFWKGCPWPTFTGTIRDLIATYPPESAIVTAFLFVLWGHFEEGWRPRYLVAIGIAGGLTVIGKYLA